MPQELDTYFKYVKQLDFADAPDYDHLRSLMRRVFEANKFKCDFKYDWVVKREKEEKAKLRKEKIKERKPKAANQKVKRNARVKMMPKKKKTTSVMSDERPVVLKKNRGCKYQTKNLNVKSKKFRYFY